MSQEPSGFVFCVEDSDACIHSSQTAVRSGAWRLCFDADHRPMITTEPAESKALVEPVVLRRRPRVLLITVPGGNVRINGRIAPIVAVLREGDRVLLEGAKHSLRLCLTRTPRIGPVAAENIGLPCPFCRVPFIGATRVYTCSCGQSLHMEDGTAGDDRLECATLARECPRCNRPINLSTGTEKGVGHGC